MTGGYSHWNAGDIYRSWGVIPNENSDFFTAGVLNMTYPGWADAEYFQDERGYLTPTPYGDIVDVLLSDAPQWLLNRYHMLVVTTPIRTMRAETRTKLETFIRAGGVAVVTAEMVESMGGIFGITASGDTASLTTVHGLASSVTVMFDQTVLNGLPRSCLEACDFSVFTVDTRHKAAIAT